MVYNNIYFAHESGTLVEILELQIARLCFTGLQVTPADTKWSRDELSVTPKFLPVFQTHEQDRRRQWQPTPVFLPGESQGWRSLVGCHLWGRTESDTTEVT